MTATVRRFTNPRFLVAAAWILPAILSAIEAVVQAKYSGETITWRRIAFNSLDWFIYAFLTPGVFLFSRRWPIEGARLRQRVVIQFGLAFVFCAAWAVLGTGLRALLQPEMLREGLGVYIARWFVVTLPFGVAVYMTLVGVEHALHAAAEVRERDVRMARMSEQLTEARLAALEARLNPHFLFNSLNTVNVLVRDQDWRSATHVIEQLSLVLRASLDAHATSELALLDELTVTRHYLAVETARFPDRLRVTFDIADDVAAAAVPRFSVQHLAENAIRHGIAQRTDAGAVHLSARRDGTHLVVEVTDDGPGIDEGAWPAGHGLAGALERLRTLHGDAASLTVVARVAPERGTRATLRLPFHAVQAAAPAAAQAAAQESVRV